LPVSFGQFSRRGQARHACSNDQDALALSVHAGLDAKTALKPPFVARLSQQGKWELQSTAARR
jgi:hypothetical protein